MGFENFISEDQAAKVAGVSTVTLKRFAEAGYLSVETDTDGLRLFSKRELSEVFGIPVEEDAVPQGHRRESLRAKVEVIRDRNSVPTSPDLSFLDHWEGDSPAEHDSTAPQAASEVQEDTLTSDSEIADQPLSQLEMEPLEETNVSFDREDGSQNASRELAHPDYAQEFNHFEREITRLTNICELQEKVLDLREAEIADLRKQRAWLEERVIRLEEKSDRDQLLLLSETQLVRQLIEMQRKRTPLRAALEWMGFVEPEKPKGLPAGKPIDISRDNQK